MDQLNAEEEAKQVGLSRLDQLREDTGLEGINGATEDLVEQRGGGLCAREALLRSGDG